MATKPIKIELDLNDRDATKKIKDLTKELGNTEEALGEVESAGKTMARAIQTAADDMIDEIDRTKRAVDAMELALEGVDMDPQQVVGDLKRIGLTAEEIELDAEELATALKSIDDVQISADKAGFTDLNKVMGETRDTGKASSAAIGSIGGSISELPGIEGLGPIAEGIGQLAEGALEGEVNVKQLAGALGVMGGTAAAMWVVSKAMQSIADTKAFNEAQAESFRDAIKEVGEGVQAVNEVLEETDEIVGRAGGTFGVFEKEIDIAPTLRDAAVSYDEWLAAVADGGPALDVVIGKLVAHRDAMEEARNQAQRNNETTVGYEQAISEANNAIDIAKDTHKNYSGELANTAEHEEWKAESTLRSKEATEAALEATDRSIEALEEQNGALQENIDKLTAQYDAQMSAVDAGYALEEAQFALTDAVIAADEVFGTAEQGSREYREAQLSVIESANGVADAEVRVATETAAAAGQTLTAAENVDIMNASLVDQASQLNGPSRDALLEHIAKINEIPPEKMTEIEAAVAAGDLELAERLINEASRTRTTAVGVDLNRDQEADVERRLNNLARWRGTGIDINTNVRGRGATGGIVTQPTVSLIGEAGPEAVIPLNQMPGASPLPPNLAGGGSAGGGGSTVYVTQNFPAGVRPTDVVDAQRKWTKRNGPQ
jgi:hypothetical protein